MATGRVLRPLATPRGWSCNPTRYLDAATVAASCSAKGSPTLWAVPVAGGKATKLAKTPDGTDQDYGDLDGVRIPSGTYIESAGACGYIWVGKVGADGRNHPLDIPGATDGKSQYLQGTDGTRLLIQTSFSCGSGGSLFWWDPTTGATQWLLGPGANGGGVATVLVRQ